eukprot:gene3857-4392_t
MAGIHPFVQDVPNSHRYVSSSRNPRVDGWWSFFHQPSIEKAIEIGGDNRIYEKNHVIESEDQTNYQEYFSYVLRIGKTSRQSNWRESLTLYHHLIDYSKN